MKEILLAWLPTVPAYFLGIYQFRFMLPPRPGVGYRLLFVVYGLVLLGAKSFSDFYWQITGTGQGLSCLVVCLMVLTLPLFLLLCFGGDWRRRLFVLFPAVCLHSFVVSPFCLLVMNQPWPLPYYSRWLGISALFFLGSLAACAISCLLCLPLIRMAEALPRPLYTALAVASPLLNMGINLQQVLFLLKNPNRLYGMLRHLPFLMLESIAIGFVFLWLVNRYARQTLAIAAAREQMHRHALEAQQRSVEQLRALRRQHRRSLEELQVLLKNEDTAAALETVRRMTRRDARAIHRYADNPVADVALADAAHRCAEAGVTLQIHGTLPRRCTLPPVDLASLLYNLFSNGVNAAAQAPRPARLSVDFCTAAGRLCVTVRNSVGNTLSRPRGEDHGFGQKILREITGRYDGSYTLEREGCEAVAVAMVCLPEEKGGPTHD